MQFKARIKKGSTVGIDFGFRRWADETIEFDARVVNGNAFDLKAPGYGIIGGDYGNGSVYVHKLDSLIVDDETRARIIERFRAAKSEQVTEAATALGRRLSELEDIA